MTIKTFVLRILIVGFLLTLSYPSYAGRVETYTGTARASGKVVYLEHHNVEYDTSGRVLEAETRYVRPDGTPIAVLRSDFRESLTVPNHRAEDFRFQEVQGLRRQGSEIILYFQDKGGPEYTRSLGTQTGQDRVLVGCQGLNYYLLSNFSSFPADQIVPLRFLIPGKLDFYDFDMKRLGAPKGSIQEFEIQVKNWILALFAPTLRVKYDTQKKQIVWYDGISNIKSDEGTNQTVTIDYVYDKEVRSATK